MLRQALRYLVRLTLLTVLLGLVWDQLWVFRSEPLRTAASRRRAPFPRLTICPVRRLDHAYLLPALKRLANDSIGVADFYEAVTTRLRGEAGTVLYRGKYTYFSEDEDELGVWRETFFSQYIQYIRCITFFPSESFNIQGSRDQPITLSLLEASLFKSYDKEEGSYRLFVHGAETPNVGDLPNWAPFTESVPLHSGRYAHYAISGRATERVSVRRRPCSSRPGYSKAQCLKECQWRLLVAHSGCRLPHMVGSGVVLPRMEGFMDHLPPCSRLLSDSKYLTAMSLIPLKRICMVYSKRFNISSLSEDYKRFVIEESPSLRTTRTPKLRGKRAAMEAINGRNSTIGTPPPPPPPPPPNIPPPPPIPVVLPFPAGAFIQLPVSVSNINASSCSCPLACRETTYTLTEKVTYDNGLALNSCAVYVSLTFDFAEEIVQETLVISLADLLASIGGFMGLFTGVSLYTFADYAEEFMGKLYKTVQTWKSGRRCRNVAIKQRVSAIDVSDLELGD